VYKTNDSRLSFIFYIVDWLTKKPNGVSQKYGWLTLYWAAAGRAHQCWAFASIYGFQFGIWHDNRSRSWLGPIKTEIIDHFGHYRLAINIRLNKTVIQQQRFFAQAKVKAAAFENVFLNTLRTYTSFCRSTPLICGRRRTRGFINHICHAYPVVARASLTWRLGRGRHKLHQKTISFFLKVH
jgi:hypothetical protein